MSSLAVMGPMVKASKVQIMHIALITQIMHLTQMMYITQFSESMTAWSLLSGDSGLFRHLKYKSKPPTRVRAMDMRHNLDALGKQ